MAVIKHLPRDLLISRATATLLEIARFDTSDLRSAFIREKFHHLAELQRIQKDAKLLGESWQEIYQQAVLETEIYESDSDETEWYDED
jgi:hypothetical protein